MVSHGMETIRYAYGIMQSYLQKIKIKWKNNDSPKNSGCYKLKSACYNIQSLQKLEEEVLKFPRHLKALKTIEKPQSYIHLYII